MTNESRDLKTLMQQREQAAKAYVKGDAKPLARMVANESPATFFGPGGGYVQGAAAVATKYDQDATLFAKDGETEFEVLESAAGDRVAYWTGLQHAKVRIGDGEAQSMDLRVTEVFRREGDAWKLVHRHADPLATAQERR